ncbi:unnamed protein product [Gordionus sp. m RMFG-2023]
MEEDLKNFLDYKLITYIGSSKVNNLSSLSKNKDKQISETNKLNDTLNEYLRYEFYSQKLKSSYGKCFQETCIAQFKDFDLFQDHICKCIFGIFNSEISLSKIANIFYQYSLYNKRIHDEGLDNSSLNDESNDPNNTKIIPFNLLIKKLNKCLTAGFCHDRNPNMGFMKWYTKYRDSLPKRKFRQSNKNRKIEKLIPTKLSKKSSGYEDKVMAEIEKKLPFTDQDMPDFMGSTITPDSSNDGTTVDNTIQKEVSGILTQITPDESKLFNVGESVTDKSGIFFPSNHKLDTYPVNHFNGSTIKAEHEHLLNINSWNSKENKSNVLKVREGEKVHENDRTENICKVSKRLRTEKRMTNDVDFLNEKGIDEGKASSTIVKRKYVRKLVKTPLNNKANTVHVVVPLKKYAFSDKVKELIQYKIECLKEYDCLKCYKNIEPGDANQLLEHLETCLQSHQIEILCNLCQLKFSNIDEKIDHLISLHNGLEYTIDNSLIKKYWRFLNKFLGPYKKFNCLSADCGKNYTSYPGLAYHIKNCSFLNYASNNTPKQIIEISDDLEESGVRKSKIKAKRFLTSLLSKDDNFYHVDYDNNDKAFKKEDSDFEIEPFDSLADAGNESSEDLSGSEVSVDSILLDRIAIEKKPKRVHLPKEISDDTKFSQSCDYEASLPPWVPDISKWYPFKNVEILDRLYSATSLPFHVVGMTQDGKQDAYELLEDTITLPLPSEDILNGFKPRNDVPSLEEFRINTTRLKFAQIYNDPTDNSWTLFSHGNVTAIDWAPYTSILLNKPERGFKTTKYYFAVTSTHTFGGDHGIDHHKDKDTFEVSKSVIFNKKDHTSKYSHNDAIFLNHEVDGPVQNNDKNGTAITPYNSVQIWGLEIVESIPHSDENSSKTSLSTVTCKFEYGLLNQWGILDCKWCPSWENSDSPNIRNSFLGLLALTCKENGNVKIIPFPFPEQLLKSDSSPNRPWFVTLDFYVLSLFPPITPDNLDTLSVNPSTFLKSNWNLDHRQQSSTTSIRKSKEKNEDLEYESEAAMNRFFPRTLYTYPICLDWYLSSTNCSLAVGFFDGTIAIWNITASSKPESIQNYAINLDVLLPNSNQTQLNDKSKITKNDNHQDCDEEILINSCKHLEKICSDSIRTTKNLLSIVKTEITTQCIVPSRVIPPGAIHFDSVTGVSFCWLSCRNDDRYHLKPRYLASVGRDRVLAIWDLGKTSSDGYNLVHFSSYFNLAMTSLDSDSSSYNSHCTGCIWPHPKFASLFDNSNSDTLNFLAISDTNAQFKTSCHVLDNGFSTRDPIKIAHLNHSCHSSVDFNHIVKCFSISTLGGYLMLFPGDLARYKHLTTAKNPINKQICVYQITASQISPNYTRKNGRNKSNKSDSGAKLTIQINSDTLYHSMLGQSIDDTTPHVDGTKESNEMNDSSDRIGYLLFNDIYYNSKVDNITKVNKIREKLGTPCFEDPFYGENLYVNKISFNPFPAHHDWILSCTGAGDEVTCELHLESL